MIRTLAVRTRPAWFLGTALVFALGAVGGGSAAAKPARDARKNADFEWSWRIPAGKTIEIKGVNGSIRASRSTGSQVEVVARKHARRSDPASVRVEFVEHDGGVTVCALTGPARSSALMLPFTVFAASRTPRGTRTTKSTDTSLSRVFIRPFSPGAHSLRSPRRLG